MKTEACPGCAKTVVWIKIAGRNMGVLPVLLDHVDLKRERTFRPDRHPIHYQELCALKKSLLKSGL
jgi:hypothetical protein